MTPILISQVTTESEEARRQNDLFDLALGRIARGFAVLRHMRVAAEPAPGQRPLPSDIATPSRIRATQERLIGEAVQAGLRLDRAEALRAMVAELFVFDGMKLDEFAARLKASVR